MTARFTKARRQAFLAALRATGNRTLAAERAKVSRSWVQLHRATDPDFKRQVEEAVAEAKVRLASAESRRPPSGWGHLDGAELVVKGTNGRRVQIARARLQQITPRVEDRFLATLAATCNVKAAYTEAGVSKGAIYTHRHRWPAFARRWDEAVRLGSLRLQYALVEYAANPFSATELPEPAEIEIEPVPMRRREPPRKVKMTPDQAMHNLHMHQYSTDGLGRRPGLYAKPPPMEEVTRVILGKIEAIEGAKRVPDAQMAEAREQWALRRRSG